MSEVHQNKHQQTVMLLEFLPLIAFFGGYWWKGMLWGTGALLAATLVVTAIVYALTGKLSKQQLITAGLVTFFGSLTLFFQDPAFIKAKVSVINLLFAGILLGGLWFNRLFLGDLLGAQFKLPDHAWRTLTVRWALFFIAMAVLNLVVWFGFSEETWVGFKTFGILLMTFVFAAANAPFMLRHGNSSAD
jgi:intracellular septation protein